MAEGEGLVGSPAKPGDGTVGLKAQERLSRDYQAAPPGVATPEKRPDTAYGYLPRVDLVHGTELTSNIPAKPEVGSPEKSDGPDQISDRGRLSEERKKLHHNLDASDLPAGDNARIRENMNTFELRAKSNRLPADQVGKTYEQVNRLYEATGNGPLSPSDRRILADQIIQHAAHPHAIDQGDHLTCSVTTLESLLFSREPSVAAKVIADVGTTGKYLARDGSTVYFNQSDLAKDREAMANPTADGQRSFASKLFQHTALNLHLHPVGEHFEQTPGGQAPDGQHLPDKEEYIDPSGRRMPFTNLMLPQVAQIYNQLTGKQEPAAFMISAPSSEENKTKYYHDPHWYEFHNTNATILTSLSDFQNNLRYLKMKNGFPALLRVDQGHELIAARIKPEERVSGGHIITITDYDETTGKVSFSNQWGKAHDYMGSNAKPVEALYRATAW